jgi:hypothetical protein
MGIVEWTIRDLFGVVCTLCTTAYYVPDVSICVFIFATYFREQDTGQCLVLMSRTVTTFACGTKLVLPYNSGSNLPLMLTDVKPK